MEDGSLIFQLGAQLDGVGQVSVVAQSHGAAAMPHDHGLGIGAGAAACGGIPDMAGRHPCAGVGKAGQNRRGKDLVDQTQIPVAVDHTVVVDGDAAALLPAVLQRVQSRVRGCGHILCSCAVIDAEHAAFFVKRICKIRHYSSSISF